jgi:hypothetical protein
VTHPAGEVLYTPRHFKMGLPAPHGRTSSPEQATLTEKPLERELRGTRCPIRQATGRRKRLRHEKKAAAASV